MSGADLARRLRIELNRPEEVSRQTLRSWRRGEAAVPMEVVFVVARLAKVRFQSVERLLALNLTDEALDGDSWDRLMQVVLNTDREGADVSSEP